MTSLFSEFFHTDNGVTCSNSGLKDLSTAQECSGAVSYANSFNSNARYISELYGANYTKGCIITDGGDMYFNTHSIGGSSSSYSSICLKGNT